MKRARSDIGSAVEWPTLAVGLACYAGFGVATAASDRIGVVPAIVCLTLALTLFASFSHEVLHDHPFRRRSLNEALVFPALGLLIPFGRFRDTHLAHHHDPALTDPYDDPETNFVDPAQWAQWCGLRRRLYELNNTLLGRMTLGPALALALFYKADVRAMTQGNRSISNAYIWHAAGLIPVSLWMVHIGQMPIWIYLVCVYFSHSILKIRTFLEHRAHEVARCRSVIIESRGILAFLFLHNNLHAVHHARPGLAWYRLPGFYAARRAHFQRRNGGYVYRSYRAIFRAHLLQAKDPIAHSHWHSPPHTQLDAAHPAE